MLNNDKLKEQIIMIENEEKLLFNNINSDKLSMLESKKKELKTASEDRRQILEKQIIEVQDEINKNSEKIKKLTESKKIAIVRQSLFQIQDRVKKAIIDFKENIELHNEKLSIVKSEIAEANESKTLDLSKLIIKLYEEISKSKIYVERFEKINLIINEILLIENYDELVEHYNNIESIIKSFSIDNLNANIGKSFNVYELLNEADEKNSESKLQEALEKIKIYPDGIEKENLLKKYNEVNFKIHLNKCENKISNDGEEELTYEKVAQLVELYRILDKDKKIEYEKRINDLVFEYNTNDQFEYQDKIINENKNKKYNFFDKFSELMGGILFNKLIVTKFYNKWLSKKLKKAERENDEKNINKNKLKLSKIGIVNGFKLFVKRNEIARMKAKLYKYNLTEADDEFDDNKYRSYNKDCEKYNNAIDFVSREVSEKLDNYSKKEFIMENKDAVINIIKQYLDTLSITNDIDEIYERTISFIDNAYNKEIIKSCEWGAFTCEANNIKAFRSREKTTYETDNEEINNMIKYYDNDPLADNVIYLKNKVGSKK